MLPRRSLVLLLLLLLIILSVFRLSTAVNLEAELHYTAERVHVPASTTGAAKYPDNYMSPGLKRGARLSSRLGTPTASGDTVVTLRLGPKQHRFPVAAKFFHGRIRDSGDDQLNNKTSQSETVNDDHVTTSTTISTNRQRVVQTMSAALKLGSSKPTLHSGKSRTVVVDPMKQVNNLRLVAAIVKQKTAAKARPEMNPSRSNPYGNVNTSRRPSQTTTLTSNTALTPSPTTGPDSIWTLEPDRNFTGRSEKSLTLDPGHNRSQEPEKILSLEGNVRVNSQKENPAGLLRNLPLLRSKVMEAFEMRRRKLSAAILHAQIGTGKAIVPFPRV